MTRVAGRSFIAASAAFSLACKRAVGRERFALRAAPVDSAGIGRGIAKVFSKRAMRGT